MMLADKVLIFRLVLAAVLGSAIGFERERLLWAAGLRTHMLVCVSAALIMIVSAFGFLDILGEADIVLDPSRVAAQVVSGVGFLGAGVILLRGEMIRGLTTAASLWSVAAVGLAVGGGLYMAGIAATVIILIILAGFKPIERHYHARRGQLKLRLVVTQGTFRLDALTRVLGARVQIAQFIVQPGDQPEYDEVRIMLLQVSPRDATTILRKLRVLPGVHEVDEGLD